jgi:hypothetical protein
MLNCYGTSTTVGSSCGGQKICARKLNCEKLPKPYEDTKCVFLFLISLFNDAVSAEML